MHVNCTVQAKVGVKPTTLLMGILTILSFLYALCRSCLFQQLLCLLLGRLCIDAPRLCRREGAAGCGKLHCCS